MNGVDTNVFVYALDADEPAKQVKALELFDRLAQQPADTVLLWQVASELLNQLRKWESQGKLTAAAVDAATSEEVFMNCRRETAADVLLG